MSFFFFLNVLYNQDPLLPVYRPSVIVRSTAFPLRQSNRGWLLRSFLPGSRLTAGLRLWCGAVNLPTLFCYGRSPVPPVPQGWIAAWRSFSSVGQMVEMPCVSTVRTTIITTTVWCQAEIFVKTMITIILPSPPSKPHFAYYQQSHLSMLLYLFGTSVLASKDICGSNIGMCNKIAQRASGGHVT